MQSTIKESVCQGPQLAISSALQAPHDEVDVLFDADTKSHRPSLQRSSLQPKQTLVRSKSTSFEYAFGSPRRYDDPSMGVRTHMSQRTLVPQESLSNTPIETIRLAVPTDTKYRFFAYPWPFQHNKKAFEQIVKPKRFFWIFIRLRICSLNEFVQRVSPIRLVPHPSYLLDPFDHE